MRRYLIVIIVLISIFVHADGQGTERIEGRWWLCFLEEAGLPLNLTFDEAANKEECEPLVYSPMQSKEPIRASKWSFVNDTLRFTDKKTGVKLTLRWREEDSCFEGTFRQGLLREEVVFRPSGGMFEIVRPQEPQRPFPYTEEEVTIERKKAGVTLSGTLTMPDGEGPFAAVVLVSGSGQQNRDEELLGHKPFLVLADYLTRHGIAVLRYDDRGVGGSKGEVTNATTMDFADDAEAVFEYLRKHKKIDPKRVGIVGHSEGAAIASVVASRNKRVAYIVMLAGQGCSGAEILLQQNEKIMLTAGKRRDLTEKHVAMLRDFFAVCDTLPEGEYQAVVTSLCEKHSEGLSAKEREEAGLRKIDAIMISQQMAIPWMKAFVQFDNAPYIEKVRCRMLAINGTNDCQVPVENLEMIERHSGGRAETKAMPQLNHLMQHCTTGSPNEYMMIEETMAPEVMEEIVKFLEKGK